MIWRLARVATRLGQLDVIISGDGSCAYLVGIIKSISFMCIIQISCEGNYSPKKTWALQMHGLHAPVGIREILVYIARAR